MCFLKEGADSINPVSIKIPARGVIFQSSVDTSHWGFSLIRQNNINSTCAQKAALKSSGVLLRAATYQPLDSGL